MTIRSSRGSAFTILELLVVLFVVGILAALLLPAIQRAREAARRIQCTSNLRQLGIAVAIYESHHRVYPPSNVSSPQRHSLMTYLLPHLDQQPTYDEYDWRQSWNSTNNLPVTQVNIATFRCPSTPFRHQFVADFAPCLNLVSPARRELLSTGVIRARQNWLSILQPSRSTPAMVTDGLANSFLLFEDAGRPAKFVDRARRSGAASGAAWADAKSSFEIHTTCHNGTLMNCRNDNEIYSFHMRGCNFLNGDGSVRFITEDIDPNTFVSRFTRAGDDIVSALH